jgi:transcription antitermination protein NusB
VGIPVKARTVARRLALDVLYEAEIRNSLPSEALAAREREGWVRPSRIEDETKRRGDSTETPEQDSIAYARELVVGVQSHRADADELIVRYADRWAIERMPVIDRNVVRMALYELFWRDDIPVAVAINEAVELVKSLSTDDSGRFVNGLLGRIVERELVR